MEDKEIFMVASTYNSKNFDLSNWKLTIPVDASGKTSGTALEVKSLDNYSNSSYFYAAGDGAMVFAAPTTGATTSGSKYPRSELREMKGSEKAAWHLSEGGTMTATLEVDKVPTRKDGSTGREVIGQIHGAENELVRLYWENNSIHFVNDQSGPKNTENEFQLKNSKGETPNVSLNEKFSYKIDAHGDDLQVSVYADGQTYTSKTKINDIWDKDSLYFKAGVYLGINEDTGSGWGQTSFYGLNFTHKGDLSLPTGSGSGNTGTGGKGDETPADGGTVAPPASSTGKTITGTTKSEKLTGTSGADTIEGGAGKDTIDGGNGTDTVSYAHSSKAVKIDLGGSTQSGGDAAGDKLANVENVTGSDYNDTIVGNDGDNVLTGGAGKDTMTGGDGADVFFFGAKSGQDVIQDFESGEDHIHFSGISGFRSGEDVLDHAKNSGDDVIIDLGGGNTIKLLDIDVKHLHESDFTFA
jgi:Ca2+-binding RTX toxin-like protein